MTKPSKHELIATAAKVMADETPLSVSISIRHAWVLVSLLQLAYRHPGMGRDMKARAKELAMDFQAPIVQLHPEAEELINMGWNSKLDVRSRR